MVVEILVHTHLALLILGPYIMMGSAQPNKAICPVVDQKQRREDRKILGKGVSFQGFSLLTHILLVGPTLWFSSSFNMLS